MDENVSNTSRIDANLSASGPDFSCWACRQISDTSEYLEICLAVFLLGLSSFPVGLVVKSQILQNI